jgi:hypothetical protein
MPQRFLVDAQVPRDLRDRPARPRPSRRRRRSRPARSGKAPADPLTAAKRGRDAQLRELTDQGHGANLDLGVALMNGLAVVDAGDIDPARFFVRCRGRHRTHSADGSAMSRRVLRSRDGCRRRASGGGEALARRDNQPRLSM